MNPGPLHRLGIRGFGVGVGLVLCSLATGLAPAATGAAFQQAWPPFVLVLGLLLVGAVASADGIFSFAASVLGRVPGRGTLLYLMAMLLVAGVTVVLNLDTAVAFLTPILVLTARARAAGESRFLYGTVFMANAASLLLPGSNLTNLLVLQGEHISGSLFLARMAGPWVAAVTVTLVVVAVAFRRADAQTAPAASASSTPRLMGILGIATVAGLILVYADSAIPVLAVGITLAGVRIAQRRLDGREVWGRVDPLALTGVFLLAVTLGALARVWTYPGYLMGTTDRLATAAIGAVASVVVNNLPAAVLLGSRMPLHPRSLLFGLNVGPNLAVTGSLSALLWWRAARSVGVTPSALRYSAVGVVLVPLTIAAMLLSEHLTY